MKKPYLRLPGKGTAQLAGPACETFQRKSQLQSLQVEARYRTSEITSMTEYLHL